MSLVFTFPGWRGGMLHSTVALLPTLYAAAMEGLDGFVQWMARRRSTWQTQQAKQVLSAGLILLAVGLSAWLYGTNLDRFRGPHLYDQAAGWLDEHAGDGTRVMVNDPASFYYHSRIASLPIPNADLDTVLRVMDRYSADYMLLDPNNSTPDRNAYLEIKRKRNGGRMKERREVSVDPSTLRGDVLADQHKRVALRALLESEVPDYAGGADLRPVVLITYRRRRFIDPSTGSRISIDTDITCVSINDAVLLGHAPVCLGNGVLEVKGITRSRPLVLEPIGSALAESAFSKYTRCLDAAVEPTGVGG